jgi:serine/threonine protein kinase/predicted ATPase
VSSQRHERISDLFLKACDLGPSQRRAFLDAACANEPEVRAEVESLLAHDDDASGALKSGAGVAHVASILEEHVRRDADRSAEAQGDSQRCPACGSEIPAGISECGICSSATTELPAGAHPIPGYRILRLLGQGGMGKVYLAEELALGRRVAIKSILEPQAVESIAAQRFAREARTMAKVEHPNIVRVYAFGQIDGRYYLVMEYVEGESLAHRITRVGALRVTEALRFLSQTAEALEAASEHGIVHRDVKPANILIDTRDQVHVADFGLAKAVARPGDPSLSQIGGALGTPHYIPPEQARGFETVDFRSDIYSLGIVLFEMLTGKPPFHGATPLSVIDQHLHTPLPSAQASRSDIPGEVARLCEWMSRKQPADRPQSYAELRQNLDALLGRGRPTPAPVDSLPSFVRPDEEDAETRVAFVGRRQELSRLSSALEDSLDGRGRVVFVTGEAGTGKTALISEFSRRAQDQHPDLIVARGNCDAQTGAGDPYLPFREVLSLLTGDVEPRRASGTISRNHARCLWRLLPRAVEALVDRGPDLVGTFVPGDPLVARAVAFTPSPAGWRVRLEELVRRGATTPRDVTLQQSYLFEQYSRTLHELALENPLVLELEDLHWADPGSCSLLFHLARAVAGSRILVLCTYRPTEIEQERNGQRHPMKPIVNELRRRFGDLEIQIGEQGTREFTDALLDCEPNKLGERFRLSLHQRTQGHPLFVLELLGSMRHRGFLVQDADEEWIEGPMLDWTTLPARVDGAVGERVGHLPETLRALLSLACVQGQEFTAEVLARMQGTDERDVVRLLSGQLDKRYQLVRAQGVRRLDGQRISTYRFRHVLFQTYLYGELDEVERTYLHEEVGSVLETVYAEHTDAIAVQLARHFEEAGIVRKAIRYLRLAADRAVRLTANVEAIAHVRKALGLLEHLPPGPETDLEELLLQLALGPPLMCTAGPGSTELSQAYHRARELCDTVGDSQQLFQTLFILVHHHANSGELDTTLELAEQLVQVAEELNDVVHIMMAAWARGFVNHYLGKFRRARADHDRVIELYQPEQHATLAYVFGMDPAISALAYNGVTTWCLGYPDQAHAYTQRALKLARKLDVPSNLAHALTQASVVAAFRQDFAAARERNDSLIRVTTEKGVVLFRAWGTIARGWILAEQGRFEDGAKQIRRGLEEAEAAGSWLSRPFAQAMLAVALAKSGKVEEGLEYANQATSTSDRTGEQAPDAEIHRIRGDLLLAQGAADAQARAEESFRQAIEIARRQDAKSWELRATISLSRLLHDRGRTDEARRALSDVYGWFREGFESRDLEDARKLLEGLSSVGSSADRLSVS